MDNLLISLLIMALILGLIVWVAQNYLPDPIGRIVTIVAAVIVIIYLLRMLIPFSHAGVLC